MQSLKSRMMAILFVLQMKLNHLLLVFYQSQFFIGFKQVQRGLKLFHNNYPTI